MKFETRDLIALVALAILLGAMVLEASGHPLTEWLKEPVGGIMGFVMGYYFSASPRQAQGSPVQTPPAPAPAPVTPAATSGSTGAVSPPELSSSSPNPGA